MLGQARHRVPETAAVLSVLSLGLVFGAATRSLPVDALPRASDAVLHVIPHVNAAISLVAIVVIGYGWVAIRRHRVQRHRVAMVTGFALFATFLALYLYKVALTGPTPFDGPAVVERFVYLPVLAVHMTLAVVCVPLLWYVFLIGITHPVAEIPGTRHPRVGRVAAALWLLSFALGVVVYLLLYRLF